MGKDEKKEEDDREEDNAFSISVPTLLVSFAARFYADIIVSRIRAANLDQRIDVLGLVALLFVLFSTVGNYVVRYTTRFNPHARQFNDVMRDSILVLSLIIFFTALLYLFDMAEQVLSTINISDLTTVVIALTAYASLVAFTTFYKRYGGIPTRAYEGRAHSAASAAEENDTHAHAGAKHD